MKANGWWARTHMWHDQGEWVRCRYYWFWFTGLKRWQILMFYIVFNFQKLLIIFRTRCLIYMGFGSKCSILNGQGYTYWKGKIDNCRHVTHFPWSYHIMYEMLEGLVWQKRFHQLFSNIWCHCQPGNPTENIKLMLATNAPYQERKTQMKEKTCVTNDYTWKEHL